ncbi:unnamed protein product [Rotaria magnacalcarata]
MYNQIVHTFCSRFPLETVLVIILLAPPVKLSIYEMWRDNEAKIFAIFATGHCISIINQSLQLFLHLYEN